MFALLIFIALFAIFIRGVPFISGILAFIVVVYMIVTVPLFGLFIAFLFWVAFFHK